MTRHSERPHIDHEDPSFGESLPITEHGRQMAEEFGSRLREFAGCVQFLASPLLRTRMTAESIAKGMGLENSHIPVDPRLGNGTFYFEDAYAVFELFRDGSFFEKVFDYLSSGHQSGFKDLRTATAELEAWAMERFTARLGIFTTHDLYNGAFLKARGVVDEFTVDTWVKYLDSAAIVIDSKGTRSYHFVHSQIE